MASKFMETEPMEKRFRGQVKNRAGGYVFAVNGMTRLRRWLILGSEDATYYIGAKELAEENIECLERLFRDGQGLEAVEEIVLFSEEGRTAKQNSLLFCFAYCLKQTICKKSKAYAYTQLDKVCRIPTHLFQVVDLVDKIKHFGDSTGWGRGMRKATSHWYNKFAENPSRLAQHVTKYKSRNGWSHIDILRLAHPKPPTAEIGVVLCFIIKGIKAAKKEYLTETASDATKKLIEFLEVTENIKDVKSEEEIVKLIKKYNLVREHIPTQHLKSPQVWLALLEKMPMTAMIRNLGKMTSLGIISKGTPGATIVVDKLGSKEALKYAKIHPLNVLVALTMYSKGKGDKGSLTWTPNQEVVQALDKAFYMCFKFVEPTNKRFCLAIDVSGSMGWGNINGISCMSPREASSAMAMVTLNVESKCEVVGFSHKLVPIYLKKEMRLDDVNRTISSIPMGGTDCALPMVWAASEQKEFDVFIVYTDSETWSGSPSPADALRQYRKKMKIPEARLIVCAMQSNGFSLADPNDPGMLDIPGFDTAAPEVMNNFILGLI